MLSVWTPVESSVTLRASVPSLVAQLTLTELALADDSRTVKVALWAGWLLVALLLDARMPRVNARPVRAPWVDTVLLVTAPLLHAIVLAYALVLVAD